MAEVASSADGGGAGGAEITGDEELAFELNQQEKLFQKCMRNRMERAAKLKQEKLEQKLADEKRKKEALELAFDNEVDDLLKFFANGYPVETCDGYGSTLLSEAAAGGAVDCIQILLGNGANPNNIGRYHRTPLWRAANAGHAEAVQILLRAGGDPRAPDDAGAKPYHVANGAEVKMLLECWDVSVTEALMKNVAANQKKLDQERKAKQKKQGVEMRDALDEIERRTQIARTEVARAQKLVVSYRQQKVSYAETGEVAKVQEVEPLLERAEAELDTAKLVHHDLEWQIKRAKLKVRDFENKLRRQNKKEGEPVCKVEQLIRLQDLSDVVIKDVGGTRGEDGRWPLVFDPTGKAATFYRYCGAAFYTTEELAEYQDPGAGEKQQLLVLAFLKHLLHGGALMIGLGEDLSNMEKAADAFNAIQKGLFNTLVDRAVLYSYLLPKRFLKLVPAGRGDDFSEIAFTEESMSKFVLGFVVNAREPEPDVLEKDWNAFYTIRIKDGAEGEEDAAEGEEDA